MENFLYFVGYLFSILMVGVGILVISGFMIPQFVGGDRIRVLFGVVVLLYGVLRFVQTRVKAKQRLEGRD